MPLFSTLHCRHTIRVRSSFDYRTPPFAYDAVRSVAGRIQLQLSFLLSPHSPLSPCSVHCLLISRTCHINIQAQSWRTPGNCGPSFSTLFFACAGQLWPVSLLLLRLFSDQLATLLPSSKNTARGSRDNNWRTSHPVHTRAFLFSGRCSGLSNPRGLSVCNIRISRRKLKVLYLYGRAAASKEKHLSSVRAL